MRLEKILLSQKFQIPHPRFQETDALPKIIDKHLTQYLKAIRSSRSLFSTFDELNKQTIGNVNLETDRDYFIDSLETLIYHLSNAFEAYFANSPTQAYEALVQGLNLPLVQNTLTGSKRLMVKRGTDFYRIRSMNRESIRGKKLNPVTIEELFHIPFELRRFITTQRYSMPGFPCLYLGSTLNVAYHEVIEFEKAKRGKKMKPKLIPYAVRLNNTYRLSCFDLSPIPVRNYLNEAKKNIEMSRRMSLISKINHYGLIWPLISSCYYQIAYKNKKGTNFKAEYVIPQLMLQWFQDTNNEVDGIRYLSVNMSHQCDRKDIIGYNFVFPVKAILEKGHCPILKHSFNITEPISSSRYKIENVNDHNNIGKMEARLLKAPLQPW
jgi:hypothetical protein